jgi:hypothetical protein
MYFPSSSRPPGPTAPTALRLLPGGVRQDDPAQRQLLLIQHLNDQTVTKRLQIHKASSSIDLLTSAEKGASNSACEAIA